MTTDHRPEDQAQNAAEAQPNPNDAAVNSSAGTPNYGSFGSAEDAAQAAAASGDAAPAAQNDGSNDNPDEFSEFRSAKKESGTEDYSAEASTASAAGAASYNGGRDASNADPEAFKKDEDVARAAFAADDPRYSSGKQSSWPSNEPAQENTDMKGGYDPAPKV